MTLALGIMSMMFCDYERRLQYSSIRTVEFLGILLLVEHFAIGFTDPFGSLSTHFLLLVAR